MRHPAFSPERERVPERECDGPEWRGVGMASRLSRIRRKQLAARDQTDAERTLWFRLRDRRLERIEISATDADQWLSSSIFVVEMRKLIIELDGGQHAMRDGRRTATRTENLEASGYLVLRFWNNDVLRNIDGVIEKRSSLLQVMYPLTLTLSPTGRGNTPERAASPMANTSASNTRAEFLDSAARSASWCSTAPWAP